jgi:hypothetical protein
MNNRENGMIDLSRPRDPDLSKKPFFIERIPLAAWIWIVGGLITIAVSVYLWSLLKN